MFKIKQFSNKKVLSSMGVNCRNRINQNFAVQSDFNNNFNIFIAPLSDPIVFHICCAASQYNANSPK